MLPFSCSARFHLRKSHHSAVATTAITTATPQRTATAFDAVSAAPPMPSAARVISTAPRRIRRYPHRANSAAHTVCLRSGTRRHLITAWRTAPRSSGGTDLSGFTITSDAIRRHSRRSTPARSGHATTGGLCWRKRRRLCGLSTPGSPEWRDLRVTRHASTGQRKGHRRQRERAGQCATPSDRGRSPEPLRWPRPKWCRAGTSPPQTPHGHSSNLTAARSIRRSMGLPARPSSLVSPSGSVGGSSRTAHGGNHRDDLDRQRAAYLPFRRASPTSPRPTSLASTCRLVRTSRSPHFGTISRAELP